MYIQVAHVTRQTTPPTTCTRESRKFSARAARSHHQPPAPSPRATSRPTSPSPEPPLPPPWPQSRLARRSRRRLGWPCHKSASRARRALRPTEPQRRPRAQRSRWGSRGPSPGQPDCTREATGGRVCARRARQRARRECAEGPQTGKGSGGRHSREKSSQAVRWSARAHTRDVLAVCGGRAPSPPQQLPRRLESSAPARAR